MTTGRCHASRAVAGATASLDQPSAAHDHGDRRPGEGGELGFRHLFPARRNRRESPAFIPSFEREPSAREIGRDLHARPAIGETASPRMRSALRVQVIEDGALERRRPAAIASRASLHPRGRHRPHHPFHSMIVDEGARRHQRDRFARSLDKTSPRVEDDLGAGQHRPELGVGRIAPSRWDGRQPTTLACSLECEPSGGEIRIDLDAARCAFSSSPAVSALASLGLAQPGSDILNATILLRATLRRGR